MGVQHMNLQIARLVAAACSDGRLAPLRFLALIAIVLALTGRASAQPPAAWLAEWSRMDFSRAPVSLLEISGGGPGRDGIPAIRRRGGWRDRPAYRADAEPVGRFTINAPAVTRRLIAKAPSAM